MTLATKARCRHEPCSAPIAFGLTAKAQRMPLDVAPFPKAEIPWTLLGPELRGIYVFVDRIQIRQATIDDVEDGELYRTHFATCPASSRFRR